VWTIEGKSQDGASLLDRAQAGDRQALEALLRDNYERVYAVCRRLTGNDADACDAAQEALIAVARGLARFDGRSQLSTWMYRIAVNASVDELRRRSRRPVLGIPDDTRISTGRAEADLTEEAVDVEAALMRLPLDFRAPVVLRDLCGLDYSEIEQVLEIPPGTVRSRIARGRAQLAGLLHPAESGS
jgi:RNA polymerase sigma-70 factor (ECF subfamily)